MCTSPFNKLYDIVIQFKNSDKYNTYFWIGPPIGLKRTLLRPNAAGCGATHGNWESRNYVAVAPWSPGFLDWEIDFAALRPTASCRSSFPALPGASLQAQETAALPHFVLYSIRSRIYSARPKYKTGCKFDLQPVSFSWRKVRKMNLSRIPSYISLLYFDLTLSTPNSPQPICIVSPCVALG